MEILDNHFENKTTYIVGNYILNGCQSFEKSKASKIFRMFKVPKKMREEVLSYCQDNEDWETLSKHEDKEVRYLVALQGHFLERFIEDEYYLIRCELANQGYALDKLMYDEYWMVRALVARQGYGLDYLMYDPDARVRAEVAAKGYGLDILVNDPNIKVKLEMVKHGYCLDILLNDPHMKVRFYTKEKLNKLNNGKNTKKSNTNLF